MILNMNPSYELRVAPDEKAVQISFRRMNLSSLVLAILYSIPPDRVAHIVAACYLTEPDRLPDTEEEIMEDILTIEGDLAGLEVRGRWGADTEDLMKSFYSRLAQASTEFYDTVEGQVRLRRIMDLTLEALDPH